MNQNSNTPAYNSWDEVLSKVIEEDSMISVSVKEARVFSIDIKSVDKKDHRITDCCHVPPAVDISYTENGETVTGRYCYACSVKSISDILGLTK